MNSIFSDPNPRVHSSVQKRAKIPRKPVPGKKCVRVKARLISESSVVYIQIFNFQEENQQENHKHHNVHLLSDMLINQAFTLPPPLPMDLNESIIIHIISLYWRELSK
jgi:hypothetical protein